MQIRTTYPCEESENDENQEETDRISVEESDDYVRLHFISTMQIYPCEESENDGNKEETDCVSVEESDDYVNLLTNPNPSSSSSSSAVPVHSRHTVDACCEPIIEHLQTNYKAEKVFLIFRTNAKLYSLSPENSLSGGLLVGDRMREGNRGRNERNPGQSAEGKGKERDTEEQTSWLIAYPMIIHRDNMVQDLQPIDKCQSNDNEKDDDIDFTSCLPIDICSIMTGSLTLLVSYVSFIVPLALVPLEIFMVQTREREEYDDDSVQRDVPLVLIYLDTGVIPIFFIPRD
ncbi:4066_t:CDS:1 [Paraglomus occultum]|uniref:4066_t:CDS:1 n=1 Tax=Paraglomus occultum TaxID=144539 RepID=A0A9N9AFL1_9GLOM|nr:4066_t:CDS:1 [Paraglomus occultum]